MLTHLQIKMTMLLPRIKFHHHQVGQSKLAGRQLTASRGKKSSQRISSILNNLMDEFDADDLALGLTNGFSAHTYQEFSQQLDSSSLPIFLRDELLRTLKDECLPGVRNESPQCRTECDALYKELLKPVKKAEP